ncbi:MAG TPA: addiction module protein [Thermoanaerobaculia bacterium]
MQEALELTPDARAALAKRLLDSLEMPDSDEHERLWVQESARRYEDLRAGRARAFAAEEVFGRLQARSRR